MADPAWVLLHVWGLDWNNCADLALLHVLFPLFGRLAMGFSHVQDRIWRTSKGIQALLKSKLRTNTPLLPPHSIGECKRQDQP